MLRKHTWKMFQTKPTLCMQHIHSLHEQLAGFHFLTSLLKAQAVVKFFISAKIISHFLGPSCETFS